MNSNLFIVGKVAILCFVTRSPQAYAEQDNAALHPINPVKKVGDEIPFVCISPMNYYGEHFVTIEFKLEHAGTDIYGRVNADRVLNTRSITTFPRFPISSKQDAGIYTCTITPSPLDEGKVVSAKTKVFIIEANERTQFAEVGEETNLTCLGTSDQSNLVTFWNFDGKTSTNSTYVIAKEDALKTFTCLVTSIPAMAAYGNITNAANEGAVTEFMRNLSVIEVIDCKDRSSCDLEVRVYGETPVNISWMIDGKLYSPELVVEQNVTTSTTSLLNLTKTTQIELHISDGPDNIWRKNMTQAQDPSSEGLGGTSSNVGTIVGGVLGGIVAIVIIVIAIIFFIKKRRNGSPVANGERDEEHPLDLTTPSMKGFDEVEEKKEEEETTTMNGS